MNEQSEYLKALGLQVQYNFNSFFNDLNNFHYTPVLIHGDFGPSNILIDCQTEKISGIIDFSSVKIGDPAIDFASLIGPFGYGEDFLNRLAVAYPEIDSMLNRAKFYASTFAIQEALFGIIHGDQKAFESGIATYQ